MKKLFKFILVGLMILSLVACNSSKGLYKAGTYTGVSKNGKGGELKVEVEFGDNEIKSVVVVENNETPSIAEAPIEKIPASIVKNQSLAIDVVSGATITSNAILEAVIDAVTQAGGDVEALKNVKVSTTEAQEYELNADIIIVGAGASGFSAAVSAAYEGAESVIVFEKLSSYGGNAIVSGGWIPNIGIKEELKADNNDGYQSIIDELVANGPQNDEEKEHWAELMAEIDAWKASGSSAVFDSNLYLKLDYARLEGSVISNYDGYPENLQLFDDWMEELGVTWKKEVGIVGYSWPRWTTVDGYYSGQGYFYYLNKAIEDKGLNIDLYTGTPVEALLTDENGNVIGVKATNENGDVYKAYASKGVVLATGGFSANGEMLVEYNTMWDGLTTDVLTTNRSGDTGDGIVMAQELGAATAAMDVEMMFPMANIHTGSTESIVGNSSSALIVNREGKRFCDETADRWSISAAELQQTDQIGFIISDAKNCGISDGKTQGGESVEELVANGELFVADTIAELASLAGIDADALAATVESYNTMCNTYEDADFGRTSFANGSDIVEGPYYAYPCAVAAHITIGGVITTENYEVLNENYEIIPGLYAAGEVVAGQCGIDMSFAAGKAVGKYLAELNK